MSLPSAISISFNRRLRASWLKEGLRLRSEGIKGQNWEERMTELISLEISGKDSLAKSMRYLRRIILEDDPIQSGAVELCTESVDPSRWEVLCWGCTISAYPFIGEVAATAGRLLKVQSEFKLEQLLRKLSASFGEKETVRRSGRYALGVIQDLGFVQRTEKPGCYVDKPQIRVQDPQLGGWFVQAWMEGFQNSQFMDRLTMAGHPSLFMFDANRLIDCAIQSAKVGLEKQSLTQDIIRLKKQFFNRVRRSE